MHRCPVEAPPDAIPLYGRQAAGPVALAGGALILAAGALAAAGAVRLGPYGTVTVGAAALIALIAATVALRPARASCSVRRAVMGTFVQLGLVLCGWLAVVG